MDSLPASPAPGTLGARIRHRRRQLGFTLDELAAKTAVSKPYLSLIENDRCNPPADDKLVRIATALSLHGDVLLSLKYVRVAHAVPPSLRPSVRAALTHSIDAADAGVEVCHA